MKLVIQTNNNNEPSLLMVPEGHAEQLQLSEIKKRVLELKLEHWDSDSNNLHDWVVTTDWGFNLRLKKENGNRPN